MFENYPKERIKLPFEFQEIYSEHYINNREGSTSASSLAQKMEAWLHRKVAKDVICIQNESNLEIGARTLNHLNYEQTKPYDIIEPFSELYSNSKFRNHIDCAYKDIDEVSDSKSYGRITSVATFEHILDLPKIVAKTCLHLNENGSLRVSIPNERTFVWKLGYKLIIGIEFKLKYGLDYCILMNYERVYMADEIGQVLKYFYDKVKCSCFGINRRIAFCRFYECTNPKIEIAE